MSALLLYLCTCTSLSWFSIHLQNPRIVQAYLGPFVDILENHSLPLMERVMTVAVESGEPAKFLVTRGPGLGPCIQSRNMRTFSHTCTCRLPLALHKGSRTGGVVLWQETVKALWWSSHGDVKQMWAYNTYRGVCSHCVTLCGRFQQKNSVYMYMYVCACVCAEPLWHCSKHLYL